MQKIDENKISRLEELAFEIRKNAFQMITCSQWGHIGGSFSCAEILAVLYGAVLKYDPQKPADENRDRLVFSKAHASPSLYAALSLSGFFPGENLKKYCRIGGLDGHLDCRATNGVEMSGGSLGCGLSTAVGMALALKWKKIPARRVYCITGDGELCEGQIWEALMSAAHYRLDNLCLVVDYNKVMAKEQTNSETSLEPLHQKLEAFGLWVTECDGHDVESLLTSFDRIKRFGFSARPAALICHTVKGMGVDPFEFNCSWHTHAPHGGQIEEFSRMLSERYGKKVETTYLEREDLNHLYSVWEDKNEI